MFGNKITKMSRHRGSSSHGWGHKKKHRGSGHRGGFGMAGTGARGDSIKSKILTTFGSSYFGKRGFHSISKKVNEVISLSYIEANFDKMVETGMIVKEGNDFVFDAKINGIDKVLGKCKFTKKLKVITPEISEAAKQKILDAKGSVETESDDEFESEEE